MTTVPRRAWRLAAFGLAATIATVSTVLGCESGADAAISVHSPPARQAPEMRNIRHARQLAGIGRARDARRPPAPGKARLAPGPARPWTLAVPSIRLATGLVTLGGPEGPPGLGGVSLPVPPLAKAAIEAGWYQFTAVPGAAGNAVIVGHVDTYIGPAVFYNLYRLHPGDPVYVNEGGARQRFDVTWVSELPKPSFPVNRVFGSTQRHTLWLITCGGSFDYKTGHYLDNIVVSATWVPPSRKHSGPRGKSGAKRSEDHQETVR
jgi:hypothetical protein